MSWKVYHGYRLPASMSIPALCRDLRGRAEPGLLVPEQDIKVPTPRMRYGQNHGARVEHEWVFVMRRRGDAIDRPQLLAEVG